MGSKRIKKFFDKLFKEDDVFWNNEIKSNMLVAFALLMCAILLLVMYILDIVGVFMLNTEIMGSITFWGLAELIIPCVICRALKGQKRWLKYLMMIEYTVVLARIDSVLSFNLPIIMILPVVLSCRYFSEKFSAQIAGLTSFLFALSSFFGAYLNMGMMDLNYYEPGSGAVLTVKTSLLDAVEANGVDRLEYALKYLRLNYLPKFLVFSLIAIICVKIAKTGKSMVLEQAEISSKNARIQSELNLATDIQANMLPSIFPPFPDRSEFDIYATMTPAKEVGGDFYDFFMVDDTHVAIVMADVSGKGVPAALFMVIAKTLIKDHTQPGKDLGEVFTEVNEMLCESNSEGFFVTAFEGVLDLVSGEFVFVNAGHELPFICKKSGRYGVYKIKHGFVLAGMEGMKYTAASMMLEPGDKIFQYTDGVTEATDKDNKLYGMERLNSILADNSALDPMQLLPAVKADIDKFVGNVPQFDDITMLCLEYKERGEKNDRKKIQCDRR